MKKVLDVDIHCVLTYVYGQLGINNEVVIMTKEQKELSELMGRTITLVDGLAESVAKNTAITSEIAAKVAVGWRLPDDFKMPENGEL